MDPVACQALNIPAANSLQSCINKNLSSMGIHSKFQTGHEEKKMFPKRLDTHINVELWNCYKSWQHD
jgi:hypothetical protein